MSSTAWSHIDTPSPPAVLQTGNETARSGTKQFSPTGRDSAPRGGNAPPSSTSTCSMTWLHNLARCPHTTVYTHSSVRLVRCSFTGSINFFCNHHEGGWKGVELKITDCHVMCPSDPFFNGVCSSRGRTNSSITTVLKQERNLWNQFGWAELDGNRMAANTIRANEGHYEWSAVVNCCAILRWICCNTALISATFPRRVLH